MVDKTRFKGRARLARDSQQWLLDYLIQETGRVFHFQGSERGALPRTVHNHDMISKHLGKSAQRLEALASAEAAADHPETALDFFYQAALQYSGAQHVIFENNAEKRFLFQGLRRAFDQVIEYAPYRIEHLDIPWNGTIVSGNLHLCPGVDSAPLIFFVPGCDMTKEAWPQPRLNQPIQRGMHVFSFDGPGQGESNLRGIRLTASNYEQAASVALDYLLQRPEIDAERVGVYALSFGAFWGMRFAARDPRIKALAAPAASYCSPHSLMDLDGPRWKQLFAYLTQSETEGELDETLAEMTLDGYIEQITCPLLMGAGEYDPRSPIEEVYRVFDRVTAPAELWVFADQHHMPQVGPVETNGGQPGNTLANAVCDWLRDRLTGKPVRHPGQVVYVEADGPGPNSPQAALKRHWYEPID
jgi:pimeloyl-ACP methyl ester carboxylesterase